MHRKTLALITGLALFGCASTGSWQPTVDPKQGATYESVQTDLAECKQLALQASGGTGQKTAKGAVVGGLIGAAAGAAIGAAVGDPGTGAAVGAAAGGIGGATKEGLSAEDQYQQSYVNCMRGRGHNVIN